mmetsp:Transcript_24384/g.59706  ORF Transcript_24384/g.59706 Transcript_24384/m.59706 type:complete len:670 (-) Transcript_24384:2688-4697(-)
MKQHNASDERKCWNSKRERERLRARFQIRERVSALSHGIEEQPTPCNDLSIENISDKEHELLSNVLVYIRKGDRSKLSLTLIDRHFDILSCRIPMKILQPHLPHTLQLCTAWFGKEYSNTLESYIGSLESFTFMEYAVWMGKVDVVGSLLIGGVNPCVRSVYSAATDRATEKKWDEEMWRTGSKVLVRFFDAFPLPLSSYIVKRVVEMRLEVYKGNHFGDSKVCPLSGRLAPQGVLLQFEPDGDIFSEPSFWDHLLSHVDSRGSNEDVVTNPCRDSPVNQDVTIVETTELSPAQKRLESLQRFNSLPVNGRELKSRSKNKKKKVAVAKSWFNAILPSLGSSQDVRRDKFFTYVDRNAIQYIKACIDSGVDLEWTNEYGQTALYICIWKGYMDMAKILVDCGASLSAVANGGSSVLSLLDDTKEDFGKLGLHLEKSQRQCDNNQMIKENFSCADDPGSDPQPATILIPKESSHPGAGSFTVDGAFSLSQVELLLELCESLPIDLDQKKKGTPCSDRSYYCDAEGYIRQVLEGVISNALSASHSLDQHSSTKVVVFPYMRFLMYKEKGTILAPHVDLCRVDHASGRRSTHTFIAYLTDNDDSGETTLLGDVSGEGRSKIMARVVPRQGRLLVFPHVCPHEGNEVDQVPKIILRGEVMLPELSRVGGEQLHS